MQVFHYELWTRCRRDAYESWWFCSWSVATVMVAIHSQILVAKAVATIRSRILVTLCLVVVKAASTGMRHWMPTFLIPPRVWWCRGEWGRETELQLPYLLHVVTTLTLVTGYRVSNTPGNPLELFCLLEILEIFWKFEISPGNFLAEFMCLLLLWLTILVFQNVSVETSGFIFSCNCNC